MFRIESPQAVLAATEDAQLNKLLEAKASLALRIEQRSVEIVRDWLLANERTWVAVDATRLRPAPPFESDVNRLGPVIAHLPASAYGCRQDVQGTYIVRLAQLNALSGRAFDDRARADLDVVRPRLEVVIVRDPDGGTDGRLFLDGCELRWGADYDECVIDAGYGHLYSDWIAARDAAVAAASPAAAAVIEAAYNDPPGDEYIEDVPLGWPGNQDSAA